MKTLREQIAEGYRWFEWELRLPLTQRHAMMLIRGYQALRRRRYDMSADQGYNNWRADWIQHLAEQLPPYQSRAARNKGSS